MIYYCKKIQVKNQQREEAHGQCPEESRQRLPRVLSQFLAQMCPTPL
jgi:hypothetical protein